MNIEWDYSHYQLWSDNEWLVDEILVLLDKNIAMQQCIECLEILKQTLDSIV